MRRSPHSVRGRPASRRQEEAGPARRKGAGQEAAGPVRQKEAGQEEAGSEGDDKN